MRCIDANQVQPGEVCEIGALGVQVQWLLASPERAPLLRCRAGPAVSEGDPDFKRELPT